MDKTKHTNISSLTDAIVIDQKYGTDPEYEITNVTKRSTTEIHRGKQSSKLKVRTEKSAVVFTLVVILFLLTHSYRMALKIYEVALPNSFSVERFKLCFSLKRYANYTNISEI